MMTSAQFDELNRRMLPRLMGINPDCATIFGMHDPYDSLLPNGGFQRLKDNLDLLSEWGRVAEQIAASTQLSRDQDTSLRVLRYTSETYRFAVEDYPLWRMRPEALEHPGTAMLMMMVREYAPVQVRVEAMASRIGKLPEYLGQFRGRFAGKRTVRIWTEAAIDVCKGFPSFLDSAISLARAHSEGRVRGEMERNAATAREELRGHTAWLEKMRDSSVEDFSMGRRTYEKLLRIRGIPFSHDELLDLADKYLAEYKSRREVVGRRIARGGTVDEARGIVERDHPGSAEEVVMRTKEAVVRARDFTIREDLISMPIESNVHVIKTPEFLGSSTPMAATYLPAVFEKSQDTVFLVSPGDDSAVLGSSYNHHMIDYTAVHEAYPGHHHQGVMSNRKPWMHQLPHIIYTPDTVSPPYESQEGWATYCEQLMADKGLLGSDEHLLLILDYCVWTACRVVSDVRLSCGEASVEEMVDFRVRESGYSRDHSEADVKGFTLVPGYSMCYLVGRHLVSQLRKDLERQLGPRFSEKRFHDLVAENGNLPFYILKEEVGCGMREDKRS